MSTEQKPPATEPKTEPKAEPNALASALTTGWDKFKQGKLISYPVMAAILVVVAGVGVTWWIVNERRNAESAKWTELEGLTTVTGLEEFAQKNPNTLQEKLARLEVARMQLGPDGIDRMYVKGSDLAGGRPTSEDTEKRAREMRTTALKSVETARESFAKLVDEFKDDPVIHVECLYACAKAEAVLVGIPKEGQLEQFRGSPAKAIEWLDKLAAAAPDTDWGKDAKKLADTLRNQNTAQQVQTLQTSVYLVPTLPALGPQFPPGFPGGLGGPGGLPIGPIGPP
jgi:hypothetical protein